MLAKADELLKVAPGDMRHLFFEEMNCIFAMREIQPEDLDEEAINDFLKAIAQVSNVLYRNRKRSQMR